jgi:hypothetical protein
MLDRAALALKLKPSPKETNTHILLKIDTRI